MITIQMISVIGAWAFACACALSPNIKTEGIVLAMFTVIITTLLSFL